MSDMFEEFWAAIPKRNRPHPKHISKLKWETAIKDGASPEQIIRAANAWRRTEENSGNYGTKYVAMAATWLNQKRFLDYNIEPPDYGKCDEIAAKNGYVWIGPQPGGRYVKVE